MRLCCPYQPRIGSNTRFRLYKLVALHFGKILGPLQLYVFPSSKERVGTLTSLLQPETGFLRSQPILKTIAVHFENTKNSVYHTDALPIGVITLAYTAVRCQKSCSSVPLIDIQVQRGFRSYAEAGGKKGTKLPFTASSTRTLRESILREEQPEGDIAQLEGFPSRVAAILSRAFAEKYGAGADATRASQAAHTELDWDIGAPTFAISSPPPESPRLQAAEREDHPSHEPWVSLICGEGCVDDTNISLY